jgi:hypothetical protein
MSRLSSFGTGRWSRDRRSLAQFDLSSFTNGVDRLSPVYHITNDRGGYVIS